MRSEPVVTIPAALALVANAVLGLLVKAGIVPAEMTAEIVGVVNGLVVLAGLLLARSQVTPVARADARVEAERERVIAALGREPKLSKGSKISGNKFANPGFEVGKPTPRPRKRPGPKA